MFLKKEVLATLIICIFSFNFITAETTLFEGDLNNFVMAEIPSVTPQIETESVVSSQQESGGGRSLQYYKEGICEVCFEDLQEHIDEKSDVNYSISEIESLALEIKENIGIPISVEQVSVLVENFEEECDLPYPLGGGFAGGRYSEIARPFLGIIAILILILFVLILILFRRLRKVKLSRKKKKSRRKK